MFNAVDPAEEPQDEGLVAKMARLVGGRPRRGPALLDAWRAPPEPQPEASALVDAIPKESPSLTDIQDRPVAPAPRPSFLDKTAAATSRAMWDQGVASLPLAVTSPVNRLWQALKDSADTAGRKLGVPEALMERRFVDPVGGFTSGAESLAGKFHDAASGLGRGMIERDPAGRAALQELQGDVKKFQSIQDRATGGDLSALKELADPRLMVPNMASLIPSLMQAYIFGPTAGATTMTMGDAASSLREHEQRTGQPVPPNQAFRYLATRAGEIPMEALSNRLALSPKPGLGRIPAAGAAGVVDPATEAMQRTVENLALKSTFAPETRLSEGLLQEAAGAFGSGPVAAMTAQPDVVRQQPAPTTAFRPTPETAEALSRVAAPPQDRMQPVREMLQPNQEQRATVPVAESQAPAAQAGDGGAATARAGGAPDLQPTARADRAQFLYEPSQGLSDEERAIEQRFAQSIGADPDRAIANYEKANTQNGTLVINTDQARDLSEDYNRDIESRSLYAAAVHEPASALVKKVWRAALDRQPTQGKEANVIFTAGGTGAGKTTAIDNVPAIAQLRDSSDIIYDGNLNNFDKAVQRIEEALASGRTADIVYVYRDPVEAMRNGALPRAERQGRTVRIDAHADSHIGSLKVVAQLMERYKGDPRVNIVVLDNSHGPGGAVETTIDRLPAWEYDALAQELINVVQADYEAGRISDRVYRGTLGQRAAVTRGTEPRLQEGDPGKPQPQRTRQPEEAAEPVDRALGVGERQSGVFEEGGHRVASTGRVYGAPPSARTSAGLKRLRERLWKLTNEGATGRHWYEKTGKAVLDAAEGDADVAEKIVGLLAIYSAGSELRGNTTMAMKAYYEWVRDGKVVTKSRIGQNVADRANSWMKGEPDAVTGVKRSTFYQNMMRVIAPERFGAEDMGATIDMWMARAFGYDSIKIGAETQHGRYAFAEKEIKRIARQLGWEPQQVQAAIWVAIKARSDEVYTAVRDRAVEKGWLVKRSRPNRYGKDTVAYVRSSPEGEAKFERALLNAALKSGTPSAERIADSALDYADTLADRTAQISWEALPSTKSDVLPGIHAAPLAQQAEYLAAIDQSLRDKNGQDEIAKLVGLAGANTVFGFSGWEGKVGEGAQTKTFVATDRPPVKDAATGKTRVGEVVVTDQARSVINLYAAIRGQLLHQDAVAWHFPVYEASLKSSNGVEIRAPGGLTHDQAQALYNEINKLAGHTDYAPIYTETGVRFLNFRDMPNREFHKLIEEAYNIVTNLPGAEFGYFRSDGELISKDKEVSSNGQDYQEVIAAARRPDLQNRIEVLRDRVSAVEARFAEKYGWDKAAGEEARADRAQGVEQRAFYGRDAIDSLEVGSNKADHPAIDYRLPGSMGQRRNVNPPDSTHQRMLNAAAHDIEAAGFPLAAAMQAVKGVVTYNGNYSHWNAAWLPDHRVVAFSEMRLIEMEGSDARQRYLRGWLAHELTHAIDDAGNGSISSGSPRLDFFVAGDTIVTKGDVVTEVAEAYAKGGKIGEFFEYPLAYAKEFAPALMKEELLAQLSRLYTTNKELMRRELPVSFKMMEDWYAQIQPDSLAATRAGLQAALRAPGAGLGGQERQLHGVDQAVSRAARGVLGVGGAGAGMAAGRAAAAGGQGAVTGTQSDLFQSAYSGEKYAVNLNLDRYDTAGAIKGLIEATAKNITDKSSRGETATHDKTLAEADRLGISEDQVLAEARKGGKPMSLPEARAYALAVRQLIVTRAEATKHFAETAFKSGSSQDRAEAMASLYHLAALQAVGMNLSAEAGRLLNSYRILAGVTTGDRMSDAVFDEERQKTAEQVLEQMFGGTNNVDDILARVALMSTQQLASPKMRKALLSRRPSAFLEIWKAGLLSGPQTHVVNMVSNMLTSLIRAPETAAAAGIGSVKRAAGAMLGKEWGKDRVYLREAAALMAGMTAGTITGARDAWQIIRHGEDANDAGKSETTGKAITGENFGLTGKTGKAVDIAGEVVRTPFRALAAEDAIFKGINRTGTLYALAYRQAIKEGAKNVSMRARELVANPTREMLKAALEDGLYFTFNNQLGAAGQKTLDILHSTKAGRLAQFAAIPFFRTPVNILKFGVHRSPLAPLTQKFQDDFKAGGARRDMALARMMTGTAIMSTAFALAASGLLTGGGEPEKERKAADRIAGWRPYSIRVGDKFFEYRRLEPLGMLLGMAADLYELSDYMSREESEQWLKMAGMAFAQNVTSKTFLSGLTNLIKAISEPQQYGDNYLGAMTGSFVPGVVGQAARARDPWERDTDPDKNLKGLAYAWDDVKRDIQARIPGQREKLPLRRDALGQPMPLTDSPSMFNPIRTGELRADDPVAMELANARARVSPAKGVIQNVKLTPEEKEAYGQASGTVARARLERLFASPAYQGLPQFLRDEKISKEMEKARTDVRNAIVGQMPAERRVEAKVRQLRR